MAEWLPLGVVTALYGDGGTGKTLAAQQLLTSTAVGRPWYGLEVSGGRALGIFCEDDETELQRRQEAINASLCINMADLGDLRLLSRVGFDNALIRFDGTEGSLTSFHTTIAEACAAWNPKILVLDTAADMYPDNENDRSKVRLFVQCALGGLARTYGCAVLLLAHPSVSGLSSGQGTSGSTAWNNTVRSRFYLTAPDKEVPDARLLTRMKANYAPRGAELKLRWEAGVLRLDGGNREANGVSWEVIRSLFKDIEAAWENGCPLSQAGQTRSIGRYFPALAKNRHGVSEVVTKSLAASWIMNGYLIVDTVNKHSKMTGLRVVRLLEPSVYLVDRRM